MRAIVDKVFRGKALLLLGQDEQREIYLPLRVLPLGIKEGDVLEIQGPYVTDEQTGLENLDALEMIEDDSAAQLPSEWSVRKDEEATRQAADRIKKVMEELRYGKSEDGGT